MKIAVLETIEMTVDQKERLEELGKVYYYDNSTDSEAKERIKDMDVVIVNWVDPSSFILSLKSPTLVTLMSTGYSWISHLSEARKKGILISNIPTYATEAVAEHIIGLMLCVSRKIMIGDRSIRKGEKKRGGLRGFEVKNKTMGIIGLGNIGKRVAEIAKGIGMDIITYNRTKKGINGIDDVYLDVLLSKSNVVCISCSINEQSKGMINKEKLELMKKDAILVGTTWGIVVLQDLIEVLKEKKIAGFGFDAAFEGGEIELSKDLLYMDNIVLTPHIGFNTNESIVRQFDICLNNIKAFKEGKELNVVN